MSMRHDGVCPKCKSREILPNADTTDRHSLAVNVYEKPGVMPRGRRSFPIKAWICTRCGYTELYVANPRDLAQSYQRSLVPIG